MIFNFENMDQQIQNSIGFLIAVSPVFYVIYRINRAVYNDLNSMRIKAGEEPLPKWRWWFMFRSLSL